MFLLNHISCPLLLHPSTLHSFCQLHQNMTSTKGICRPCKTLESKCSQKQMLRQRFKSKYLGAGDPRSGGRGKWDREGKEVNGGTWCFTEQVTLVASWSSRQPGQLREKRMCHSVFPVEEDREFISRLLSITGAGEAAAKGHSFSGRSSLPSHRQWSSSDQSQLLDKQLQVLVAGHWMVCMETLRL